MIEVWVEPDARLRAGASFRVVLWTDDCRLESTAPLDRARAMRLGGELAARLGLTQVPHRAGRGEACTEYWVQAGPGW